MTMGLGPQARFPTHASVPPMRSLPLKRTLKQGRNLILLEVWLDKVLLEIVRAELIRFANALTGYKCLSSYTYVCVCVLCICVCVFVCVYMCCVCMCVGMWVCVCVYVYIVYVCVCACMYDVICQNERVPSVQKDSTSETRHALKQYP